MRGLNTASWVENVLKTHRTNAGTAAVLLEHSQDRMGRNLMKTITRQDKHKVREKPQNPSWESPIASEGYAECCGTEVQRTVLSSKSSTGDRIDRQNPVWTDRRRLCLFFKFTQYSWLGKTGTLDYKPAQDETRHFTRKQELCTQLESDYQTHIASFALWANTHVETTISTSAEQQRDRWKCFKNFHQHIVRSQGLRYTVFKPRPAD